MPDDNTTVGTDAHNRGPTNKDSVPTNPVGTDAHIRPPTGTAGVPTTKRKRSTKERLFEAAMSLIGERGYGGASVDAIAAKAGVAKGIVYYYFDSKAALAEQLIASGLEFLAQRLQRAITPDMDPLQAMEALAAEELRQVDKRRDFAKFLLSEMWHEDRTWRETLDARIKHITVLFAAQITRGIEAGIFKPDTDVDFIAQMIFATFLAAALNRTVLHPELDRNEMAQKLTDYALAGLLIPADSATIEKTSEAG
jgi:AcrR family transcriptional regulator